MALLKLVRLFLAHFSPFGWADDPASLGLGGAEGGFGISFTGRSPASVGPTPLSGRLPLGPGRSFTLSALRHGGSQGAVLLSRSLLALAEPVPDVDWRCRQASNRPSSELLKTVRVP
jgi:hypothetical protein